MSLSLLWGISIFLLLLGVFGIVYGIYCRRTMAELENMLEAAFNGDFEASRYDEGRLSRLEVKTAQFLAAGALSRRTVEEDRRRLGVLLGDISHQTKTPIANLCLYSQLLQEQELAPEAKSLAGEIAVQSRKLSFLIRALIKLSRLEIGVIQVQPQEAEVRELIEEAAAAYAPAAGEKSIELSWESPDITAHFDKKWTAEALGNILDNAVKYTPAGGKVSVRAEEYQIFCRIDVADTGPGIARDEQTKIFSRFYRSPQAAEAPGVGVGLYLAREIAATQGGYIKVSSEKDKGSVFSLFLPKTEAK
ncbi:MAG: HAMP domain-containing sensor histidine kinase [Bacillota bacterium]|nr:HAMP domain-containing sensor histidine kinase [Bacillota bacterium]